jgi:hypothetical protein
MLPSWPVISPPSILKPIIPPRLLQLAVKKSPDVPRLLVPSKLGLGQLLRHLIALVRHSPKPNGKLAVVHLAKVGKQLVELANEMLALLEPRSSLFVRGDVNGVGLDDDLFGLCNGFFGGFGGDESFDLLQGKDGGFELDLRDAVVGLVEEGGLVVGRVDVAEDGAAGGRSMFQTADRDNNWAAVAIFVLATLRDAADVTRSQDERSAWMIDLDAVVVWLFVPSLRWGVQAHRLGW